MPRIQFELSEQKLTQLERLMQDAGMATKKELLSNAVTLLEWAVREKQAGRTIASIDEDRLSREVLLPALENVMPIREPLVRTG